MLKNIFKWKVTHTGITIEIIGTEAVIEGGQDKTLTIDQTVITTTILANVQIIMEIEMIGVKISRENL